MQNGSMSTKGCRKPPEELDGNSPAENPALGGAK